MNVPRGRLVLAVLVLGGAGFALSATTWLRATVPTVLELVDITVPGTDAVPAVSAASLAVLAAALAVAIGGRAAATLGGLALVGIGALVVVSAVGFIADPDPVALSTAAEVSGVRQVTGEVTVTLAPYAAAVVGALVAAAGIVVAVAARSWRAGGRRFERAGAPAGVTAPAAGSRATPPGDDGDRPLVPGAGADRGAPAAGARPGVPDEGAGTGGSDDDAGFGRSADGARPVGPGAAPAAAPAPGSAATGETPDAPGSARLRAMDDWDALGRGEDPSASDAR
ncbi:Trp biosynthesis-associated membrane protein [Georgenia wangjunii]|uniref:Trp biosynthesis-associated membrane protein n=1 Tax=Georgenia wangjunii TaxID=3117730 RepID=UPI002F263604